MYLLGLDALDEDAIHHGDDGLGELGDTGSLETKDRVLKKV